jgi:hypothetical protein
MAGAETAIVVADLAGLVGALCLAVPFFVGQTPRDTVLIALARRSPDQATFDQTTQRHVQHIAKYWHWEAFFARAGICLIAMAFMIRLGVALLK